MNEKHIQHDTSANTRHVCVRNELGLHARPAARLAQEAQRFASDIQLIQGDLEVDAKSILDILSLAAGQGCALTLKAEGEDAGQALDHLSTFIENLLPEEN
ncbi:MAG: HPr family phosphocarrier protein [Desulfovibrio sp.]|nr:MAG: HPr family phosphocarrier protein [Desulfovibrio sp.]